MATKPRSREEAASVARWLAEEGARSEGRELSAADREYGTSLYFRFLHLLSRWQGGFADMADDELFDSHDEPRIKGVTMQDRSAALWGIIGREYAAALEKMSHGREHFLTAQAGEIAAKFATE